MPIIYPNDTWLQRQYVGSSGYKGWLSRSGVGREYLVAREVYQLDKSGTDSSNATKKNRSGIILISYYDRVV